LNITLGKETAMTCFAHRPHTSRIAISMLAPALLALTASVSAQETAPAGAPENPEIKQVAPGGETPNEIQTEAGNNQPGSASEEEMQADGQNQPEGCKSMLDRLAATQSQFMKDRDARRVDVAAAAQAHPLVLVMDDGDFVYLGGEEELSEPLESWFVNEEIAEKRETAAQKATRLLDEKKDAECAALLQQAMDDKSK
jgi:hypothetical protein